MSFFLTTQTQHNGVGLVLTFQSHEPRSTLQRQHRLAVDLRGDEFQIRVKTDVVIRL